MNGAGEQLERGDEQVGKARVVEEAEHLDRSARVVPFGTGKNSGKPEATQRSQYDRIGRARGVPVLPYQEGSPKRGRLIFRNDVDPIGRRHISIAEKRARIKLRLLLVEVSGNQGARSLDPRKPIDERLGPDRRLAVNRGDPERPTIRRRGLFAPSPSRLEHERQPCGPEADNDQVIRPGRLGRERRAVLPVDQSAGRDLVDVEIVSHNE